MMTFICSHCKQPIHGVAAVQNGIFLHHRCTEEYEKTKLVNDQDEKEEIIEVED